MTDKQIEHALECEKEWNDNRQSFNEWRIQEWRREYDDPRNFHVNCMVIVTVKGGLCATVVVCKPSLSTRKSSLEQVVNQWTWDYTTLEEAFAWCDRILMETGYAPVEKIPTN